jgi:hypothetical protein
MGLPCTCLVYGFVGFFYFSLVQCVAVLNVSVRAEACCLVVSHHGQMTITAEQQLILMMAT